MRASANYFFEFGHFHLNATEHLLQHCKGLCRAFALLLIREGEILLLIGSTSLNFFDLFSRNEEWPDVP
jgi:hypothetical protein